MSFHDAVTSTPHPLGAGLGMPRTDGDSRPPTRELIPPLVGGLPLPLEYKLELRREAEQEYRDEDIETEAERREFYTDGTDL